MTKEKKQQPLFPRNMTIEQVEQLLAFGKKIKEAFAKKPEDPVYEGEVFNKSELSQIVEAPYDRFCPLDKSERDGWREKRDQNIEAFRFSLAAALGTAKRLNVEVPTVGNLEMICEEWGVAGWAEDCGSYVDLLLYVDAARTLAVKLIKPIQAAVLLKLLNDINQNCITETAIEEEIKNAQAEDRLEEYYLYGY